MKKIWSILIAFAGLAALLTPSASAAVLEEDALTDSLASKEEVRWYSFEMEEPGDAVLIVTGLQDHWDGYPYHWSCTLYGADQTTSIAQTSVRGYSGTNGPSVLAAPGLDAGTYHVQMASISFTNPMMAAFTAEPYKIQLCRSYPSTAAPLGTSDQIKPFQNAGDVLWAFDGTAFFKLYDGECYGALVTSKEGAVVPVLIGAEEDSVAYVVSSTGEVVPAGLPKYCQDWGDGRYYYSYCGSVGSYTETPVDTSALPMLYVDTDSSNPAVAAAEAVFERLTHPEDISAPPETAVPDGPPDETEPAAPPETAEPGDTLQKTEDGGVLAWMGEHKVLTGLGAFLLLCFFLGSKPKKNGSRSGGSSYSSSYPDSGYGSSLSSSTPERTFTEGGPTGCGIGGSFCGCGSGR